jgi:hypothetical protein
MALNSSVVWMAGLFTPEAKIIDKLKKKIFFIDAEIERLMADYKTIADYWQKESEKTLLANTRLELKVKKLEEENLALRDELATECVERQELISSKATLQV